MPTIELHVVALHFLEFSLVVDCIVSLDRVRHILMLQLQVHRNKIGHNNDIKQSVAQKCNTIHMIHITTMRMAQIS